MCGIFFSLSIKKHIYPSEALEARLNNRGPDWTTNNAYEAEFDLPNGSKVYAVFYATVLSLRGEGLTQQPLLERSALEEPASRCLCWNGEAWLVDSKPLGGNDGKLIFDHVLKRQVKDGVNDVSIDRQGATFERLACVDGPFAFVYLDQKSISFGRDFLGRRSLVMQASQDTLIIASVSDGESGWSELEANMVYTLHIDGRQPQDIETLEMFESTDLESFCKETDITLQMNKIVDDQHPQTPYRLCTTTLQSTDQIESLTKFWNDALYSKLSDSIKLRVSDVPKPVSYLPDSDQVRVAILFSGGLDCTILARMIHDILPSSLVIDLLNVAFENPRKSEKVASGTYNTYEACPDRITARASYLELCQVCSHRTWRLVTIDVPYTETLAHREMVTSLMNPHNTEMDLSISCALYFASRGVGRIEEKQVGSKEYISTARVLISGLGADEIFGGYQRHSTAYHRHGYEGLLRELDLDFKRLGKRNLGRDDRVMSHWGKEVRFPYLDENFIKTACECPAWVKCGFGIPSGAFVVDLEPGKRLLRLLAQRLGLKSVANEKKRAIQFGARTAKMEKGKTKGTDKLSSDSGSLTDHQMHLMLLEQQDKKQL